MTLLAGKKAFVTGATRGIGRGIALRLAEEGADITFTYRSSAQEADTLVQQLTSLGVKAKGFACDASQFQLTQTVVWILW